VLNERNRAFLGMKMESESVDCCGREVVIHDAVEAQESAFCQDWATEVAAFELALCSSCWKPGFPGRFGGCL
jgi:hypothetical protein